VGQVSSLISPLPAAGEGPGVRGASPDESQIHPRKTSEKSFQMIAFDLNSSSDLATMRNIGVIVHRNRARFKTMCVGQPQSVFALCCGSISRRLLGLLTVVAALALSPSVSRADFIGDAGLNQPLSGSSVLSSDAGVLLDLLSGQAGSSSSTDVLDSTPAAPFRQNDDHPSNPLALAGNATGGCGSTSGSAAGGASASPVGIVNDIAAPVAETCSGRIAAYAPLSLPSPLAARLLDPPRDVA